MSIRIPQVVWIACLALAGCTSNANSSVDAGANDAGEMADLGVDLGVHEDGGTPPSDFGVDAGAAAFGVISGPCGRVLAELATTTPSYLLTHLDFADNGYDDPEERTLLTEGAQEILADGTAGGSSGLSEAFAFEVLARCEDASFVKSETEIAYDPPTSKKTDILISIDGMRVGVSVTRAESFPLTDPYTAEDAAFIERKLDDILESSANVVEEDRWVKQILLVMAYGDMHAEVVRSVWEGLDAETRADTILYIVVTDGNDEIIY